MPTKNYSLLKGAIKSLRPAILGGGAAVAAQQGVSGSTDLPATAIITVATWAINLLINWMKNR